MFNIAGEYLMADPKQSEPNQAPTEVPVNEPTSEIKKRRESEEGSRTAGKCCADQLRQVGQTGVFI